MAESERRTFSNMLAILVERGLEISDMQIASAAEAHDVIGVALPPDRSKPSTTDSDYPYFKPDFK